MEERDFQQLVVRSWILRPSFAGCSRSLAANPYHETVGPNSTKRYSVGETDFECWSRLWKACASHPELDGEEWVTFLERIQEHFGNNDEKFPDEFYFWGDFSGDRTLDLKIAKPTVLTARLLSDLQKYLQLNGQKMWRIRIPIYFEPNDPHRVVVVYPHAIDILPVCQGTAAGNCRCDCCLPQSESLEFRLRSAIRASSAGVTTEANGGYRNYFSSDYPRARL